MKSFLVLTLASLSASTAGAYSLLSNTPAFNKEVIRSTSSSSRRDWLTTTAATVATVTAFGLPSPASADSLATFNDAQHGFSISVPTTWVKSEQELNDRRKICVWGDPNDAKTALFIAYTPVRDDFTSLSSFGAVDQVAAQTIMPKGEIAGQGNVQAEMISSENKKQAYIFDYTQAIADIQPPTHFRTIFTLVQGATGGAGAVLVTITLQTPEERYAASMKPLFDQIVDSYGKST